MTTSRAVPASPSSAPRDGGVHPLLMRQLRRAGLDAQDPRLAPLLDHVSRTYADADQDRYTMERSLSVVSEEMRALYEDLRVRSDATHEATIAASPDGILLVDEKKRVLSINRAFVRMWRIDAELTARGDYDEMLRSGLRCVRDPDAFVARIGEVYGEPRATAREELLLTDGRVIDRETVPVLARDGERVLGRVWIFRDITDAKRQEGELRAARDAAEKASRAKSMFLANMSHELRTPLNSILGFSRVVRRAPGLDDDSVEYTGLIVTAAEHMLGLVNDLLDLRKLEDDGAKLELVNVNLAEVAEQASALVGPLFEARHHTLACDIGGDAAVVGDRRAILQIIVNLLSNAAKFTLEGGRITVVAQRRDGRVEVAVKDNGIGIPADSLDKLFTYYAQLDGKSGHGMKGSGIGLALTRALVHKLGGEIGVESIIGVGSTFRFALPSAPPPAGTPGAPMRSAPALLDLRAR